MLQRLAVGGVIVTSDATGILQLQSAGTATVTVGTAGGVGIGTTTTTNAKLTVNANTVLPATAPPAGTNLWVTGADAAVSRITLDTFGAAVLGSISYRASAGTAAAPTAVQLNAVMGSTQGFGYGATAYSNTSRANATFYAAENWTDAAQGTYQAFGTTAIGTITPAERMRIDNFGNVTLQKNISVGGATPTTSGSGITFPATQSASSDANTLDDYEEGTWTPAQGSGLTVVGAFSSNGLYTKIGRQVTVYGVVLGATSVAVTPVGIITSNMPFTTSSPYSGSYVNGTATQFGATQTSGTNLYSSSTMTASNGLYFSVVYTV